MNLKTCGKCKEEKPLSEFNKNKNTKDGLCSDCRECKRQYYKENKEKIKRQGAKYYKENTEKIRQRHAKYYKENAEKCKQQRKEYREENKEKIKRQGAKYREENKEKINQRARQYYKENAEMARQQQAKYQKNLPAGVYYIKNTVTGQIYIGQSTKFPHRWHHHKSDMRRNKHENPRLQEDYNKYGLDIFEFGVIKEFPCDTTSDVLLEEETKTITEYARRGESLYNYDVK